MTNPKEWSPSMLSEVIRILLIEDTLKQSWMKMFQQRLDIKSEEHEPLPEEYRNYVIR